MDIKMNKKTYHHGDLRNALIEAGIKILNNEGEKQFSLRKVAVACNVSHAAPYSHFKDKDELLAAMQEHVTCQLTQKMQDIIDTYEDKTQTQLMIDLGKCYVLYFLYNPHYFSFLFFQSHMEADLDIDADIPASSSPFQLFKVTAIPILINYGIAENDLEDYIIGSWAKVHGLASIANMKNVHYSQDWEAKIEQFIS